MSPFDVNRKMMPKPQHQSLETAMVGRERWVEIRHLYNQDGEMVSSIARLFDLDRKTVRRCLHAEAWQPYQHQA